jgi:hypothetical protein
MLNIYELSHTAECPNGNLRDAYDIKITSSTTLMAERLLEILHEAPNPIYQEDFATYLRSKIGAKIEVVGCHHGIKITSVRE